MSAGAGQACETPMPSGNWPRHEVELTSCLLVNLAGELRSNVANSGRLHPAVAGGRGSTGGVDGGAQGLSLQAAHTGHCEWGERRGLGEERKKMDG